MWKVSKFAHFLDYQDVYVIFNYLTNSIIKVKNKRDIDKILSGKWLEVENQPLFKRLIKENIVAEKNTDEDGLGRLSYYDTIFNRELSITILSSEECNFRCKYCYENFKHRNISEDVIENFSMYFKKVFREYEKINIDWFGGEPLLGIEGIDALSQKMIELCRQYGKPYTASITTNGYLLTPDIFYRLLKDKVYSFQITLDGLSDVHDSNRVLRNGGGTFDTIINNLRNIRDTVKSSICNITIRTNVTRSLLDSMDSYLKFMEEEFGHDNRFKFYFRPVGDWGGNRVKTISNRLISSLDDLYSSILTSNHTLNYDAYANVLFNRMCPTTNRNNFILGTDGTIYKCTMLFDEEFNKIGSLLKGGKLEINYEKLSKWVLGNIPKSENCKQCNVESLCNNRNCAAKYFIANGRAEKNCGYEHQSIDYVLKLLMKSNSKYIKTID